MYQSLDDEKNSVCLSHWCSQMSENMVGISYYYSERFSSRSGTYYKDEIYCGMVTESYFD